MLTAFDLLEFAGIAAGGVLGLALGAEQYGWLGGFGGAVVGAGLGYVCGRIPFAFAWAYCRSGLRSKRSDELREALRGPAWPAYHLYFQELVRRGEDVSQELPVVMKLLTSDFDQQRIHGWSIARRFFPDLAARMPKFDPSAPTETCRAMVEAAKLKTESDT
jgi:hypothetical protein